MKKLITFIWLLTISSLVLANQTNLLPLGNPQVANKSVVKLINNNCHIDDYFGYTKKDWDKYNKRCVLSNFSQTPYYEILFDKVIENKKVYIFRSNKFNLYLKKTIDTFPRGNYLPKSKDTLEDIEENDAPNQFEITLFVEKSNKIINHLVVHFLKDYAGDLAQITLDFYIDKKLNIWLLEHGFNEEGASAMLWKHYHVEDSGKFNLLDETNCHFEDGIDLLCDN